MMSYSVSRTSRNPFSVAFDEKTFFKPKGDGSLGSKILETYVVILPIFKITEKIHTLCTSIINADSPYFTRVRVKNHDDSDIFCAKFPIPETTTSICNEPRHHYFPFAL